MCLGKEIRADKVVHTFAQRVRELAGNKLLQLILYGSRARGDHNQHSDYDFLIVLSSEDIDLVDKIRDVEVEMLDSFNALVSALVLSNTGWQKRKTMPLGFNIQREGVAV